MHQISDSQCWTNLKTAKHQLYQHQYANIFQKSQKCVEKKVMNTRFCKTVQLYERVYIYRRLSIIFPCATGKN